MGKADLHIHSAAGDALPSVVEILEYVEQDTDLDLIAITDHDLLEGALEARDLVAKGGYRFQMLVGMEITTLEGHLLAYDIEVPIRMLQRLAKTVTLVHEQGGFCVVPHPMNWLTLSVGARSMHRLLRSPESRLHLDGIELFNPSFAGRLSYEQAVALNQREFHLPELGGSDAHFLSMIGRAYTVFPGKTPDDLRLALQDRTTSAVGDFMTWEEHRDLASMAGQQMVRSLLILPGQHIKRAVDSFWEKRRKE